MKKFLTLLLAFGALLSFSCNKYCTCDTYIDGKIDKNSKNEFVNEKNVKCKDYSEPLRELDGKTYEVKCK